MYNVGIEEYHKEMKELRDRQSREMREKEARLKSQQDLSTGLQKELKETKDKLKQGCYIYTDKIIIQHTLLKRSHLLVLSIEKQSCCLTSIILPLVLYMNGWILYLMMCRAFGFGHICKAVLIKCRNSLANQNSLS